jgi:hypothetical protein
VDEWRRFLAALERLQAAKRMHVVMLAHSQIRTFKNPEGPDYDRYAIKLNDKAAGPLKEWVDALLFARHQELAHQEKKKVRGVSTGARLLHTERSAAYDAKNRYGLPPELPLSWADFWAAMKTGAPAEPAALKEEILRKAKELGGECEKAALSALERAGADAQKLSQLNAWTNAKLAERAG